MSDPYAAWPDDRVRCGDCARTEEDHRRNVLLCGAWYGPVDRFGKRHHLATIRDLRLRCFFFVPKPGAADPRKGRERWPCTEEEYREAWRRRRTVWWADEAIDTPKRGG